MIEEKNAEGRKWGWDRRGPRQDTVEVAAPSREQRSVLFVALLINPVRALCGTRAGGRTGGSHRRRGRLLDSALRQVAPGELGVLGRPAGSERHRVTARAPAGTRPAEAPALGSEKAARTARPSRSSGKHQAEGSAMPRRRESRPGTGVCEISHRRSARWRTVASRAGGIVLM